MELHKIGPYLIIACFLMALVPVHVAGSDLEVPLNAGGGSGIYNPEWSLLNPAQERSKIWYTAEDFRQDGEKAALNGKYEEAIRNYNKAEELLVGPNTGDLHALPAITQQDLSKIEGGKAFAYSKWPGHTAEEQKAVNNAGWLKAEAEQKSLANSECLIVTATFGSPLASQVQLVRSFRDDSIKQSYTGSRFMPGFNAWYYSFSPQVSTYINEHPFTKPAMQVILNPLLGIVRVSQIGYLFLAFSPELATFAALCIGSTLYAGLYVFPFVLVVMWVAQRHGWKGWNLRSMKPVAGVWAAIAVLLVLGVLVSADILTTVASGLFVIATIILVAGGLSVSLLHYTHIPKIS